MNRRPCELCGQRPIEGLVLLRPMRAVCRPCRALVRVGARLLRKHGPDKVRELVDAAWRKHAD